MTSEPLTCPYCNARQPNVTGLKVGQRLTCARCGDGFAVTHVPIAEASNDESSFDASERRPKPLQANRRVAVGILAVMTLMAGVGLTYALLTVQTRRDHDKALPRKSRRPWQTERELPPDEIRAPSELDGLRYLPTSTGIVAAIEVQSLLAGEYGKELRSRSVPLGKVEFQLDNVKDFLGVGLDEIDHVVLGVVVRDGDVADLTPPTQFVVRTRGKLDPKRVQVALKAHKPRDELADDGTKRTLYSATVRNLPITLWFADERTFVVGLFGQFGMVPGKPQDDLSALPSALREVIEKRIAPGSPTWMAGHADDWKKTWLPTLVESFKNVPLTNRLGDVDTFAIWLIPTQPAKVQAAFHAKSESLAEQITQKELHPRSQEINFKYSREQSWLDVQITLESGKKP